MSTMSTCEKCGTERSAIPCPDGNPGCEVLHWGCRKCLGLPADTVTCPRCGATVRRSLAAMRAHNVNDCPALTRKKAPMTPAEWLQALQALTNMIPADLANSASESELRKVDVAQSIVEREERRTFLRDEAASVQAARDEDAARAAESHRRWCALNDADMAYAKVRAKAEDREDQRLALFEQEVACAERSAAALERIANYLVPREPRASDE